MENMGTHWLICSWLIAQLGFSQFYAAAGTGVGRKADAQAQPSGQQARAGAGKGPPGLEAALHCEENLASDDAAASPGMSTYTVGDHHVT